MTPLSETFIRAARLPPELRPVPIYAGDPPKPINASWLALSRVPERAEGPERYLLYFLSESGELLECLPFETLEIAVDQACAIAGLPKATWCSCKVEVTQDWLALDPRAFPIS
jgi:hypothetical protein